MRTTFQFQRLVLLAFTSATLCTARVSVSNLNYQVNTEGLVTLSAQVTGSNPSNLVSEVTFHLQKENGSTVSDQTVTNEDSSGVYTVQVGNLDSAVKYCFKVRGKSGWLSSLWSNPTCFTPGGECSNVAVRSVSCPVHKTNVIFCPLHCSR